jgi:hypothetical protein
MNAIFYLGRTKLKNELKSLIRKPSRLIYVLVIVALLVLTLAGGNASDGVPGRTLRSTDELAAIAAGLYLLMFLISVNAGFSRGGSMFSMSDVDLLFPSPIRSQSILFHGLFQQMTASLFVGFFLLFQYSTLHGFYGISYGQLLLLLLGYALATFLGQVTAMLIYSHTSHDDRRQTVWKAVLYLAEGAVVLYVLANGFLCGMDRFLSGIVAAVNGTVFHCFPVVGWLTLYAGGMMDGNGVAVLAGLLLCAAFLCFLILLIFHTDPDYYEDVIKSAEITRSAITAKKEGLRSEAVPLNVRVGKTGLNRGWGASAIFYKHLIENRRSRKFLLSTNALIFAVTVILFSLFMRGTGLLPVFLMSVYMQMFSAMLGRFNLELTRPFIYLIPEPPMRKLFWSLAESLPSALLESVVIFIPVGVILSLDLMTILMCVAARLSFALLYTAANVVEERIWGGVSSRVLTVFLFFLMAVGLAIPGIVAVCVLSFAFEISSAVVLLGTLILCNLPFSVLALFLCRDMLQYAELNNQ